MRNSKTFRLLAGVALAVFGAQVQAASVVLDFTDGAIISTNSPATGASAKVTLDFADVVGGVQATVTVQNTTGTTSFGAGATTSTFTGFALDFVSGITSVSLLNPPVPGSAIDTLLTNEVIGGLSNGTPNAGTFSFALADNNNFEGGNANGGLAEGGTQTASVLFATALPANDVMTAYQTDLFDTTSGVDAAIRFQQVNAGAGSDKLLFSPTPVVNTVPLPAGLGLALAGIAALGGVGITRRRRAA